MYYNKSVIRSLAMVMQLGLCVLTPIFLCIFIGFQADSRLGTKLMVPMLILGVLAGVRCAWKMVQAMIRQEKKDEERFHAEHSTDVQRTGISKPKQVSRILKDKQASDSDSDSV